MWNSIVSVPDHCLFIDLCNDQCDAEKSMHKGKKQ